MVKFKFIFLLGARKVEGLYARSHRAPQESDQSFPVIFGIFHFFVRSDVSHTIFASPFPSTFSSVFEIRRLLVLRSDFNPKFLSPDFLSLKSDSVLKTRRPPISKTF